ncbi:MAG: SGNH/GDSL hydrolase family protein [Candidatus Scalindua sp.]|nr:SGNH/GDSL hydrolase family protein [Candidatus Scalindua sp.]
MKHNNRVMWVIILAASLLLFAFFAQDKIQALKEELPAHLQKAMANPLDSPDLPNVLIIGDSISIGYTVAVRRLLDGKADVFRPMTNCNHSGTGVRGVKKWIGGRKWDVIHFNFGIWDTHYLHNGILVTDRSKYKTEDLKCRYTTEQYVENLSKIVAILKETDAKLIWASTTPYVSYGEDTRLLVVKNNKAARELMAREEVTVNDLYNIALANLKEWQSKDGCHFTRQGYEELARQVAPTISDALSKKARAVKPATVDGQ